MVYTVQVHYPAPDNKDRAVSVIHIEGNTLSEVMANARREIAMIPGAKAGACVPGRHVRL